MHGRRVMLLGSGGLTIGQAGEFDYSGSQAIKALNEEGAQVILVNPNVATIQTSEGLADRIYFLPLTAHFVKRIIEREKPDGILLSFGGQTALNCGVELHHDGILEQYGVEVLGTPIETVIDTEDRDLFAKRLAEIGVPVPPSQAVTTVDSALEAAETLGYPVLVRAAYTLGGLGSRLVHDRAGLSQAASAGFAFSPQLLVERALTGWKEIEYEVIRDRADNCITVCNMENFDPLGIHTGESIVVAPSQTLSNDEYHELRETAVKTIRRLGVVGECNIQFAINPRTGEYVAIEVNARLSRSSALASKATGYPLAFVAAKLACGKLLPEIPNAVTRATTACFEPALDYVVVKVPRWDFGKFRRAESQIGSSMKSVGEVMSIGRSFEEALQKAVRMVSPGVEGVIGENLGDIDVECELQNPTHRRLLVIAQAIHDGWEIKRIQELTGIDPWFLYRIQNIVRLAAEIARHTIRSLPTDLMRDCKRAGFSDLQIGRTVESGDHGGPERTMLAVRRHRIEQGVRPVVKQIDTTAGEFPAETNYLYLTYHGETDDIDVAGVDRATARDKGAVVVLGSGAYRIGSSVEFDWCCVNCVSSLERLGYRSVVVNHNPETVSTDYDVAHRLYFEELTLERVLDIVEKEDPLGVVVSMGGQTPNNLALPLNRAGVKVLGTSPSSIDAAEDRHKFSALLDQLGVDQPRWHEVTSAEQALTFARDVGYPVLVRPSYVLSGAAMNVAYRDDDLLSYLTQATRVSPEHPVVVSEFIAGAKEIEVDAVARRGEVVAYAMSEHVENAGVHSGDAVIVLPPQQLFVETVRRIKRITREIAGSLSITGPFNVQYLAKEGRIRVIECNLRASRSFPFASKVFRLNFVDLATRLIMNVPVGEVQRSLFELDYVAVKAPQFSFARLAGADPVLGVEMASTGEVACFGDNLLEAFLKSLLSVGYSIPQKGVLLSTGTIADKTKLLPAVRRFRELGLELYASPGTAEFLDANNVPTKPVPWPLDKARPNALDLIASGNVDLVLNIPKSIEEDELTNDYLIRRQAVDRGVPLLVNTETAALFAHAISQYRLEDLKVLAWDDYVPATDAVVSLESNKGRLAR
ncbi:MAG: carbamoyl-phosphate synthase (glutamine-hydrolyzing) large subunit [Candidatus Krumholzibacteria bacterium]|nr:carbamoyl-phosphate synthase (glutamine-hydrolyzing) large subunit [Candidatus Krumholzibacteria bacterium]